MRKNKEGTLEDFSQGEEWVRRRRERNKKIQTKSLSGTGIDVLQFDEFDEKFYMNLHKVVIELFLILSFSQFSERF